LLEIGREILSYASRFGGDYVDVRIVRRKQEEIEVKNGVLENARQKRNLWFRDKSTL